MTNTFIRLLSTTFFYVYQRAPSFLVPWIVFSSLSCIGSYCFDLFAEWDLLNTDCKHRFLRKNLAFVHASYYYSAIFLNIIFRLSWTVQLIPLSFFGTFMTRNLLSICTSVIENVRVTMWNCLRIEVEHLKQFGNFNIV